MTETTPPQITQKLQLQIWWFTALLIAINVGLFGWQILSGVNITDPSPMDAIAWGADFPPLTFSGQPERLFNSMFFHIFGLTVSGVNNAAHIGGMIMGVLLAIAWYFSQKVHKKSRVQIVALIVGMLMLAAFYSYCNELSTGLHPLWSEILRQNQLSF